MLILEKEVITVYMNKKGIMIKQICGGAYAIFTNYGSRHVCDRNNLDDAVMVADSL